MIRTISHGGDPLANWGGGSKKLIKPRIYSRKAEKLLRSLFGLGKNVVEDEPRYTLHRECDGELFLTEDGYVIGPDLETMLKSVLHDEKSSEDLRCLASILLFEDLSPFTEEQVREMTGAPLNPIKTEQAEVIRKELENVQRQRDGAVRLLEEEKAKMVRRLKAEYDRKISEVESNYIDKKYELQSKLWDIEKTIK